MFQTVQIPIWLLLLILLFATVTFASHFLFPSVRWFFRKRLERVVRRLNQRLERPIEPFRLARRQDLIRRLTYDPDIAHAIRDHAREEGLREDVAFEMVRRYAREIVPSFSASLYFGTAVRLARRLSRTLYRVRLGYVDEAALQKMNPDATVVFVMNHRSNMDYVLVTYLAASRSALSYAVGEWARAWPLKHLIRTMGAYFIRRRSRNALYRRVLARYVQMATAAGVTQAVFPEGGLTRDGLLKPAKLGLLNYIVSGFDPDDGARDVLFVPVGLNYDHVLEDRLLLAARRGDRTRIACNIWRCMCFLGRHIRLRVIGRFHRFGYASVSFGTPVSLRAYLAHNARDSHTRTTAELGRELMRRVGRVVPVLPVSLIATVLLDQGATGLSRGAIQRLAAEELDRLTAAGACAHIPRRDLDDAVETGLCLLVLRRAVSREGENCFVGPEQEELLRYYANAIAHLRRDCGQKPRLNPDHVADVMVR
ncbi:MAG: 1-acyl-sn-glycerol-3-phosphate acyltransferase [Rhodobacteraceae bacterium]|nr:1-acyl-sn-glycerol-3-phosphate acyltransferase [Paracoccaceae bacterium]